LRLTGEQTFQRRERARGRADGFEHVANVRDFQDAFYFENFIVRKMNFVARADDEFNGFHDFRFWGNLAALILSQNSRHPLHLQSTREVHFFSFLFMDQVR
jgi:hypothetical protein